MIEIVPGETYLGSDRHYRDEGPVRLTAVEGFLIDERPVTNDEFSEFIHDAGYVTVAERELDPTLYPGATADVLVPGSLVFTMPDQPVILDDVRNWWHWTPGTAWNRPLGPGSDLNGLGDHPVVHVSHEDVAAYATWAGKRLPTEAEWEYAARGGLDGAEFTWGDHDPQETHPVANTWQGHFPDENTALDGWIGTSPVGSYPPNGYGLYDMAGNVWEWTDDWYLPHREQPEAAHCCSPAARDLSLDPNLPGSPIPRKVVKGGSHLCTPQYCFRYRPAARQAQMIDTATSHMGFRCVRSTTVDSSP
jgi:sulfatase modifying factor 1